jgi:L-ribulose-5-phosphate 3-epimerase
MEWTLDQDGIYENPLLTGAGQAEIRELSGHYDLRIPSLTGDCFMQAPFWKAQGKSGAALKRDFVAVAEACSSIGISILVIPLVDNGHLENEAQENELVSFLESQAYLLANNGLKVAFECDFCPQELGRLIAKFDPDLFGINYDIGNSAALGYDPTEELSVYGHRVINVHIKDRIRGGTTVPLGTGNADFNAVFASLTRAGFAGNYILQTARANDSDHVGALVTYRDMTLDWLNSSKAAA